MEKRPGAALGDGDWRGRGAQLDADHTVRGGAEVFRSGGITDGSSDCDIFLAGGMLARRGEAEFVAGFNAGCVSGAGGTSQRVGNNTGVIGRMNSRIFRIRAESGQVRREANLGILRGIGDLGGVHGANAADSAGFVCSDAGAEQIGYDDGRSDKRSAEIEATGCADFTNGRGLGVNAHDRGLSVVNVALEEVSELRG